MKNKINFLVATQRVNQELEDNDLFKQDVLKSLKRFEDCDWGEMCKEDKDSNDFALNNELRLFASYETVLGKIWIITESDRSATTILFPEEY